MPVARVEVQAPDGRTAIVRIEAPEGTTGAQLQSYAESALAGGPAPVQRQPRAPGQPFQLDPAAYAAAAPPPAVPPIPEVISPEVRMLPASRTPMQAGAGAMATEALRMREGLKRIKGVATMDPEVTGEAEANLARLGQETGERFSEFPVSTIAGSVAPYMAIPGAAFSTPVRAAATGAGLGALTTGGDPLATGLGALGGAAGGTLARHLARPITPSPQAQQLMAAGIQPSIGQGIAQGPGAMQRAVGPLVRHAEESLQNFPLAGGALMAARRRPQAELTQVALNRAMPAGEKLPADTPVRDALNIIRDRSRAGYDEIYNNRIFELTPNDIGAIQQSVQSRRALVDPAQRTAVLDEITQLFQTGRVGDRGVSGDAVKFTQSKLRERARNFTKSQDPVQREIGGVYQDADKALTKWIRKGLSDTEKAKARDLDRAYANQLRVERAASALGADEGQFTAAQLQNAVKAMAGGVRKSQFARGGALMQDLSEPAKTVLTGKTADSGTPTRLLYNLLSLGGLGGLSALDPATGAAVGGMSLGAWGTAPRFVQRYALGGFPGQAAAQGPMGVAGGVPGALFGRDINISY